MSTGVAHKITAVVVPEDDSLATVSLETLAAKQDLYCFCLDVFADLTNGSEFNNDKTAAYFKFSGSTTAVTLSLYNCDGLVTALTDDTYGTLFPYGFYEADGRKYAGYLVNWRNVLNLHGVGDYYVQAEGLTILGDPTIKKSFTYTLNKYSATAVNGTVRIEFTNDGTLGDPDDDKSTIDYLDWYSQIRVRGYFGVETSEHEIEVIEYTNGERQEVTHKQEVFYDFEIYPVPQFVHRYLRTQIWPAEQILITDYNAKNPLAPVVKKSVKFSGNHEPKYLNNAIYNPVTVKMKQAVNRLDKKYCSSTTGI